ncbi:ABC transporter permease [Pseudoalteromonas xiamenensis]|uniref:ABC transporter permease n=1 Tax=Pseudoalteromonas xiamenensis TaxID=882626 RepID=UPI0027E52A34|nr:ABC transporter permease [Pseudoalteromonas xiamenensis]WMN60571.1 ABC transporter permease [Pseudoalteromonas xiamenensis]
MRLRSILQGILTQRLVALLVTALIALALGAFGTTLSVFQIMSSNPMTPVNSTTAYVVIDDWDPLNELDWTPPLLSYNDGLQLFELASESKRVLTYDSKAVLHIPNSNRLFDYSGRVTTPDFFSTFGAKFQYGDSWNLQEDLSRDRLIVLSDDVNKEIFGGSNSVGKTLLVEGENFTVSGVLAPFEMTPKVYDLHVNPFGKPEGFYIPFNTGIEIQLLPQGRLLGWRNEEIQNLEDVLKTSMIWLQLWLQFDDPNDIAVYQSKVLSFVEILRQTGRVQRHGERVFLYSPSQWLQINHVVKNDSKLLLLMAIVFLIICLLCVVGLMLANYASRKKEFAIYRALGASRNYLIKRLSFEVMLLTTMGCFMGVLLIFLGLNGIQQLYGESYRAVTSVDVTNLLIAIAIIYVSTLSVCAFPITKHSSSLPASLLK